MNRSLLLFLRSSRQDVGIGRGKNYALNFPLRDGINDENYKSVFEPVSTIADKIVHGAYTSLRSFNKSWSHTTPAPLSSNAAQTPFLATN